MSDIDKLVKDLNDVVSASASARSIDNISAYYMVFSEDNFKGEFFKKKHIAYYAQIEELAAYHKRGLLIQGVGREMDPSLGHIFDVDWEGGHGALSPALSPTLQSYYFGDNHQMTIMDKVVNRQFLLADLQWVLSQILWEHSDPASQLLKKVLSWGFIVRPNMAGGICGVYRVPRKVLSGLLYTLAEGHIDNNNYGGLECLTFQMYSSIHECPSYDDFLQNKVLQSSYYMKEIFQGAKEGKNFDLLYYMFLHFKIQDSPTFAHRMRSGDGYLFHQIEFCLDNMITKGCVGF